MPTGIPIIKNKVFPKYFQNNLSLNKVTKFLIPTNLGSDNKSHWQNARSKEANTGRNVKMKKPTILGAKKP